MKHASLLIAFCVLLSLPAFTQSTTTVEKNASRITITTKKVDESGKTITETYIAEGNEPAKILEEMAINPEMIQKVEVLNEVNAPQAERLFLIRSAGDNTVIEGILDENAPEIEKDQNINRVIIINQNTDDQVKTLYTMAKSERAMMYDHGGNDRKSNCAALGVYVNTNETTAECRITALIDQGGAQAAGLKQGDVITKIGEYEIVDFETLHNALSNFRADDVVTVRYIREDKNLKAKVELKDWAQLPGHEHRARTDCAPVVTVEPEDNRRDAPGGLANVNALQLQDVRMYPNPTDGAFALSFSLEPGPLSVTITDINGKIVFNENKENSAGTYYRDIDLKSIPQGNYVLTVTQGDKRYTDQISKQ